jgi:diguanylate cyclase (GGDEF)-like protein/PAS domain S-box-containing protein
MATTRWWNSIATQVWGMVLACAVLLAGLIFVNARADASRERSVVSDSLQRRGTAIADLTAGDLKPGGSTEQTLDNLVEQPVLAGAGPGCPTAMSTIQRAVDSGFIAVVDVSGKVLCAAAPTHVTVGQTPFVADPVVLRAVAAGKGITDGPFLDPGTHELSMLTAVPVPGPRKAAMVYVFPTQDALSPIDTDKSLTSIIIDQRSDTVLMHYPQVAGALGASIKGTGLVKAQANRRTVTSAVGFDRVRRLYRAVPLKGTPYLLLVGVSEDKAYAPVRAALRRNLLMGLGLMVVVGLMGLFLQRRIAHPARTLRQAIDALADDPEAGSAPVGGPSELAVVAHAFNVTAEARRRADGLSRAILQHASDHLLVIDETGRLTFIAPVAQAELGLKAGARGQLLMERVHPDDRERLAATVKEWLGDTREDLEVEARVHDHSGRLRHIDIRAQDLRRDRYVGGVVLTCRDVTERKQFEEHLSHQARHDSLTGLANRTSALEHLAEILDSADELPVCVFFIDLDRFKLVNDSHGHSVGDSVLIALARKLRSIVRPDDLVARFGGDEFVVVTQQVAGVEEAEELAVRIRRTLEEPLLVARRELFVSGSVGIAMADVGDLPETVLRNADTAMYRAKEHGRNCSAVFDDEMRAEARRQMRTESDLHRALERDQLALHFQPVVALADGRIDGVEALVRWNHPEQGLVVPSEFIPVAEETGLVVPIGAWVLRSACAWAAATSERLGRPIRVSVNLSPRQLAQPDVVALVVSVLRETLLPAQQLCLEVTESVLVQDAEVAARTLHALHDLGVRLSIDDFGTGWSSLTYLQQFPVDEIKLDRSYVSRVDNDRTAAAIVAALVGMAHTIGLRVTAEGVETQAQATFLRAQHCDSAQGYLFARPLPAVEVEALLVGGRAAVHQPRYQDGAA